MTKFTDIKQDTPRLVVMFQRQGDKEGFQWGMHGTVPLLSLIGFIVRIQTVVADEPAECPQQALVIVWDEATRTFDWFVHKDIPTDPLIGMLETIKATLLSSMQARRAAAQQVQLYGANGEPLGR